MAAGGAILAAGGGAILAFEIDWKQQDLTSITCEKDKPAFASFESRDYHCRVTLRTALLAAACKGIWQKMTSLGLELGKLAPKRGGGARRARGCEGC